jgi:hypothetical protein
MNQTTHEVENSSIGLWMLLLLLVVVLVLVVTYKNTPK